MKGGNGLVLVTISLGFCSAPKTLELRAARDSVRTVNCVSTSPGMVIAALAIDVSSSTTGRSDKSCLCGFVALPTVQGVKKHPPSNPLRDRLSVWEREMKNDPDREFILDGIRSGFRITDQEAVFERVHCENNKSVFLKENRQKVEEHILKEIQRGAYVKVANPPAIVSALGAVPKSDGNVRLIHDGSRPEGKSVNTYATNNKLTYETIDGVTKFYPKEGGCAR